MIIEKFKNEPGYPFDRYFDTASQYVSSIQYWLQVIISVPSFIKSEWEPIKRPPEIQEDMYIGKVIDIISKSARKEINIQTASVLGYANAIFKENRGYSEKEYREQKEIFGDDFHLDRRALGGITYEEALEDARKENEVKPLMAWVEKGIYWHSEPSRSEGGYEVNIERLILTSEISERAEPMAIHALDLFLQPGPAMERVNRVFAPD